MLEEPPITYPDYGLTPEHQMPLAFWNFAKQHIPEPQRRTKRGKPRIPNHQCMTAILYVLRNGGEWSSIPASLGKKSTMHDRFQEWNRAGVFENIWTAALELLQYLEALDLEWQSMDGAMVKAPLGGEKNGTQSNGQRETGGQTQPSRRWQRFTARTRPGRSKPA
jgi:putative transposase